MKDVQETLDKLVPEPARMSDWEAVLREAKARRRSLTLQLAAATGIIALAALFAVAPWKGSEPVGILDRALAAVGDGPVLHVVFRGGWGGTLVDLKSAQRTPVYGEREVWFDPSRDVVHQISRFGGAIENEELYNRNKGDRELTALWRDYRPALENGTARVIGQDVVDGVPVYWIIVRAQMLPDVADHKKHEFAQQVAVSRETFKPVAMRYTRDRHALENDTEHILRFETMSVGDADFTGPTRDSITGRAMMFGSQPTEESARTILGRDPYWLGTEYEGLPLAQTQKARFAISQSGERLVTGERAAELRKCVRMRSCKAGVSIRDGRVYETPKPQFGPEQTGVVFFYGTLGDDPSTFKKDSIPMWAQPHVEVTETTSLELISRGAPMKYLPPEGSVLITAAQSGLLVRDGIYISIAATDEDAILAAARALRPMSANGGSGAGG